MKNPEKMLTPEEKPILHVPDVVGREGDECLLPEAASEVRCRRSKEIPWKQEPSNINEAPVLYLVRGVSRGER